MNRRSYRSLALTGLALIANAAWGNHYTITDLGPDEEPVSVNSRNTVASNNVVFPGRAEVLRNDIWRKLTPHSKALGANRRTDVVGFDSVSQVPMFWPRNAEAMAIPLSGDNRIGKATGINDSQEVVGWYDNVDADVYGCFSWSEAQGFIDFGEGSLLCTAADINNAGQVAGSFENSQGNVRAFLWTRGEFTDLGVLSGTLTSFATAINDGGDIVGVSFDIRYRGFVWDGALHDLDPMGQYYWIEPLAINGTGESVGWAQETNNGVMIAMRFAHSESFRLNHEVTNAEGWNLEAATAINDKGVIVGYGVFNEQTHGFMLTPQ